MLSGLLQRQAAGSVYIEGDSHCTEVLSLSTTQKVDTAGGDPFLGSLHKQNNHKAVSVQS